MIESMKRYSSGGKTNKLITLIFSIIFVVTFFMYAKYNVVTVSVTLMLIALNTLNFLVKKKWVSAVETLIYEAIGVFGIYYISWFYVFIFIMSAETINFFRKKALLILTIVANSIFYIYVYYAFSQVGISRGIFPFQAGALLLMSIILSVFFVTGEKEYEEGKIVEEDDGSLEHKYNELLTEHQHTLILKEIMDISTQSNSMNDMLVKINELLLKKFDDVDYTTIFLYDTKRNEFRIVTSNVPVHFHKTLSNIDQFEYFEDITSSKIGKVLNSEMALNYPTAGERNILSALCEPLYIQKDLLGLILMESKTAYAFNEADITRFSLIRYNISLVIGNKQWIDRMEKMALIDGLTGVYNRNYLFDFLEKQTKWHRENNKILSMVLFDIDHFKRFNDTYGHLFGDLVLKEVSALVKDSIRETDLVARYGGEEFIIILVDTPIDEAEQRINEIRLKIQDKTVKNDEGVVASVTVSFGIAEFAQNSYNITVKDLIERADQALYKSKDEGRNRVSLYKTQLEG